MTAAAMVLLTAALCIWLAPAGYILGSAVRERQHQREDARRRTEQDRVPAVVAIAGHDGGDDRREASGAGRRPCSACCGYREAS